MIRLLAGDCRQVLATLPAESVQCVVTSPPYYALRSYLDATHPDKHREIGSEATPDEYLATMVGVFREIKRVLREDGTAWVNLGSSYASGGKRASLSPSLSRVPAYDSDGKEPSGSPAPDCAYPDPNDGLLSGSQNHRDRSDDNDQHRQPALRHDATIGHDSAPLDLLTVLPWLTGAQASTILSSMPSDPVSSGLACEAVGLGSAQTSHPATLLSSHKAQSTGDTSLPPATSADRRQDKGLSSRACDCGSCGICWAYLATPLLKFKAKDLMMMPELLALALQADGWYIRSSIIWHKPNPMPESCRDRPTSAHEHVFLLTRSARYFYDADAVRIPLAREWDDSNGGTWAHTAKQPNGSKAGHHSGAYPVPNPSGANCRNVWTIATHAYSAAHFATFPPELAERCIKAGTSERGCCAACGKPWGRITSKAFVSDGKSAARGAVRDPGDNRVEFGVDHGAWDVTTTGWAPCCDHDAATVPCTVLDPFAGAGTTLLVADRLQRDCIGIDLNTQYTRMAMDRCIADAPLFTSFPPAEPPEDERMADLFTDMAAD